MYKTRQQYSYNIMWTALTALLGGGLFALLQIPVPWLIGPMVTMVICQNVFHLRFSFSHRYRNAGMAVVGYTIGLSMTAQALKGMAIQLPSMLLITLLLMVLCAGIATVVSFFSGNDYHTSLLGSIPGGLTQVMTLAEETKGVNLTVVTVTQVFRLMTIIIAMPLIVMLPIFDAGTGGSGTGLVLHTSKTVGFFPNIILFIIVGILLTVLGTKINFPTSYLLGPIMGTILLQLAGVEGPPLPPIILHVAQLAIGTHIGLMLDVGQIANKGKTLTMAFASGILLVTGGVALSFLLTGLEEVIRATALLSTAPGGMDQMSIIAHEIDADLSVVSGYQLFRTLFIFFVVPPLLKMTFQRLPQKRTGGKTASHPEH